MAAIPTITFPTTGRSSDLDTDFIAATITGDTALLDVTVGNKLHFINAGVGTPVVTITGVVVNPDGTTFADVTINIAANSEVIATLPYGVMLKLSTGQYEVKVAYDIVADLKVANVR